VALARGEDPTLALAGFWIAFTVVLFLESGCLVVQQVTLALASRPGALPRLVIAAAAVGAAAAAAAFALATRRASRTSRAPYWACSRRCPS
jgi:hypothetical protein